LIKTEHSCSGIFTSQMRNVSAVSVAWFFISGKFVMSGNHWMLGQQQHSFMHLWHLM